ncbi:MAG: metalloregulator ArsR/SmtB family transcription factor [Mailhella sp.]|nr:metalloregulator ArsR/SmtB family transcription factor [Mailhella sp.]
MEHRPDASTEETLRYLKALSDETRLRIAGVLCSYELSVNELVTLLGMGQSRVSRHLKILYEAGLIRSRRDGLWVFYSASENDGPRHFLDGVISFMRWRGDFLPEDMLGARDLLDERNRKTRQFFNAIADEWDALNREVLGDFSIPDAACEALPSPCPSAADLGCGTGEVLDSVRAFCGSVIGVDGSPRMLELAKRRFAESPVSLRLGDLEHLPMKDEEVDFASVNLVLHHLSEPGEAFPELSRVLRRGGRALIIDFDRHDLEDMRKTYGDRWLGFSAEYLRSQCAAAGLRERAYERRPVRRGLALHMLTLEKM